MPLYGHHDHLQGVPMPPPKRSSNGASPISWRSTTQSTTATLRSGCCPQPRTWAQRCWWHYPSDAGSYFARPWAVSCPIGAVDFECTSWGQFFLKFILSHPAVTAVITGHRQGRAHDRQSRRRTRAATGCQRARAHGRVCSVARLKTTSRLPLTGSTRRCAAPPRPKRLGEL